MIEHWISIHFFKMFLRLVAAVLFAGLAISAPVAIADIDPEADKVLRSMSVYLGDLSAFSASADVDTDVLDTKGRMLQLSSSATVIVKRPSKLYVHRRGAVADVEVVYDGEVLTVHGKDINSYQQVRSPGTIDDALGRVHTEIGLDMPASDLFFSDAYAGLMDGVVSGDYLGTAYVNGVECHHLAFRQAQVDWQMWVQTGEKPLPMKYVITSKWVTGAPQYTVRMRDWDTQPSINPGQFTFSAPKGASKVDKLPVDEMGEIILERYSDNDK